MLLQFKPIPTASTPFGPTSLFCRPVIPKTATKQYPRLCPTECKPPSQPAPRAAENPSWKSLHQLASKKSREESRFGCHRYSVDPRAEKLERNAQVGGTAWQRALMLCREGRSTPAATAKTTVGATAPFFLFALLGRWHQQIAAALLGARRVFGHRGLHLLHAYQN